VIKLRALFKLFSPLAATVDSTVVTSMWHHVCMY